MFRAAFVHIRCLILADAYFEWRIQLDGQHPYALARWDGVPMMFVELWDIWKGTDGGKHCSFTLITTESNDIARPCHDRMSVTVENENLPLWLADARGDVRLLLRPAEETNLKTWPVRRQVNSSRNNDDQLLEAAQ